MVWGIEEKGSVQLPGSMSVGGSNSLRVFQKNGHQFFGLSDVAGTAPAQQSASTASGHATYGSTVENIKQEILTSTTTRPLLDRMRDPRNHTAKTQVLQLVQAASQEAVQGSRGPATKALEEIAENRYASPLLASALASAIGGAGWVTQQGTKNDPLNLDKLAKLAASAAWICAVFSNAPPGSSQAKVAAGVFAQLNNHEVFGNPSSPVWSGLRALHPQWRSNFYSAAKVNLSGKNVPTFTDFMAGKLGAQAEDISNAMQKLSLSERSHCYLDAMNRGYLSDKDCKLEEFITGKSGVTQEEFLGAIKGLKVDERLRLGYQVMTITCRNGYNLFCKWPPNFTEFATGKPGSATPEEIYRDFETFPTKKRFEFCSWAARYSQSQGVPSLFGTQYFPSMYDFVAGKVGATSGDFWNATLQAYPIEFAGKKIDSFQALQELVISPLQSMIKWEYDIGQTTQLIMREINGGDPKGVQSYVKQLNAQMKNFLVSFTTVPDPRFLNYVQQSLDSYGRNLAVQRPSLPHEVNSIYEPVAFAQTQLLEVTKGISRFLPRLKLRCNESIPDQRPALAQLREAIEDVRVYLQCNNLDKEKLSQLMQRNGLEPELLWDFLENVGKFSGFTSRSDQSTGA
jgi:hypothetical protein